VAEGGVRAGQLEGAAFRENAMKVLQIPPAMSWWAVYGTGEQTDVEEELSLPLVCWALVEDSEGDRQIIGIDADQSGRTRIVRQATGFRRYEFRGEMTPPVRAPTTLPRP